LNARISVKKKNLVRLFCIEITSKVYNLCVNQFRKEAALYY
jgi:hypothetical protein